MNKVRKITIQDIAYYVSNYFELSQEELFDANRRLQDLVYARQISFYLFRKYLGLSLPKIGRMFAHDKAVNEHLSHSTVIHGIACVHNAMELDSKNMSRDPALYEPANTIEKIVKEHLTGAVEIDLFKLRKINLMRDNILSRLMDPGTKELLISADNLWEERHEIIHELKRMNKRRELLDSRREELECQLKEVYGESDTEGTNKLAP